MRTEKVVPFYVRLPETLIAALKQRADDEERTIGLTLSRILRSALKKKGA